MSDEGFLSRWSRRKSEAKTEALKEEARVPEPAPEAGPVGPTADAVPAQATLPAVESLTPESDFTPFMKPEVDADTKRKAVKMLFQDPRFNVMDGLDVYIDDYSKPDPLPEGWLEKMTQTARLGEYLDPERVVLGPDPENAAKTALQEADEDAARAENAARNEPQPVPSVEPRADTSAAGSPVAEVKQSPPAR